ncbi:MAG: DUF6712 family protein [Marinifilaceae bacterium]
MDLLFRTTSELRKFASFIDGNTKFEDFVLDLQLATEDVISVIGKDVYLRAVDAYNEAPEGINDQLIQHIQLPVAILGYLSYAQNNDVTHSSSGRRVMIDKDSETMAWEWMLEKDDKAMLKKANRCVDRLISFLDDNIDDIIEWKESDRRRELNSLFVKSAVQFNDIVPIDSSRSFFLRVMPYIRQAEREVELIVGKSRCKELKRVMVEDEILTEEQNEILFMITQLIPALTMAKAVRRLSVSVLPDAVVQLFTSDRNTMKSSTPATKDLIASMEAVYKSDADRASNSLQRYITSITPLATVEVEHKERRNSKYASV